MSRAKKRFKRLPQPARLHSIGNCESARCTHRRTPTFRSAFIRCAILRVVGHTADFGLDAVDGSLDLFEFGKPPGDAETLTVTTRNHPPPSLTEGFRKISLRDKVLRLIFQRGFFKVRNVQLETELLPGEIHLPYWLGFYGTSEDLRCRAMDAVRRRIEGARASALFEHWLAA